MGIYKVNINSKVGLFVKLYGLDQATGGELAFVASLSCLEQLRAALSGLNEQLLDGW